MLSLRRQQPVDIVELAFCILAIIPLTDAYDQCDVSGRLTVTGRKSYPKYLTAVTDIRVICSDTDIETTIKTQERNTKEPPTASTTLYLDKWSN